MSGRKWGDASSASAAASSSSSSAGKVVSWGDEDGDDDGDGPLSPSSAAASSAAGLAIAPVVPVVSQSKVDAKGVKTVVEFGTNAQGEKIRITRKIKVRRPHTQHSNMLFACYHRRALLVFRRQIHSIVLR
jgi:hypothetical protein